MGALQVDPVLVTGATGFVGRHVALALRDAGHEVVALVRDVDAAAARLPGIRCVGGDLERPESLRLAMKEAASVVHVAGFVSNSLHERERLFSVNAVGAWNLLEAAGTTGVRRVVFTSSTSAVGALHEDRPEDALDESAPFELRDLAVPYVQVKRAAHEAALEAREDGLPVVVLSPTFVLGPGDERLTSSELIDAFVRKQLPGYLAGGINPVDVRDVARAYVAALVHPDPAPHYILAGPENLTQQALFQRLEELSGVRAPRIPIPRWAALAAGLVGERLVRGAALTSATVRLGGLYWYFDAALARRELGFDPRPLDQTLRSSLDWVTQLQQTRLGEAA
jgi:dihydroflavonol-4-reductase